MSSANPQDRLIYAWCFSHGTLHQFDTVPWCTASWVSFQASTAEQAMEAKEAAYGGAVFLDDLPYDKRLKVIQIRKTWDF